MRSTYFTVAVLTVMTGCGGGQEVLSGDAVALAPMPENVREVYDSNSGYEEPTRLVVRSQEEWTRVWATLVARQSPTPPLPEVDFGTEMLLVAAMGTRNTGGYTIDIPTAVTRDGTLTAKVREESPGPNCILTQAVTTPAVVVRALRHDGSVEFVEEDGVHTCQ
jgi:hypothetical protein